MWLSQRGKCYRQAMAAQSPQGHHKHQGSSRGGAVLEGVLSSRGCCPRGDAVLEGALSWKGRCPCGVLHGPLPATPQQLHSQPPSSSHPALQALSPKQFLLQVFW